MIRAIEPTYEDLQQLNFEQHALIEEYERGIAKLIIENIRLESELKLAKPHYEEFRKKVNNKMRADRASKKGEKKASG